MTGVYVIAEAGVNHNGRMDMALQLVDAAVEAGADAVKFQTFTAEKLVTAEAPKADYQIKRTDHAESQLAMLRHLELGHEEHHGLAKRCAERKIEFLSTPFDSDSLRFLVHELTLKTLKISSGDLTNGPLLLEAAHHGCKIICSTGMSTMEEIKDALGVMAFGYTGKEKLPCRDAFREAYNSDIGRQALREKITLLHCTSEYPAPFEDINLKAMDTMAEAFGLAVGFSDHSPGSAAAIAAAARGACVIEKHFTLDQSLPGPDHKASIDPQGLSDMIAAIREVELALGDGDKRPSPSELKNRTLVRKSLVADHPIKRGDRFSEESLAAKRPGNGLSPMEYWDRLGRKAERDYNKDEIIG